MKVVSLIRNVNDLFKIRSLQLKSDWCKPELRCTSGEWVVFSSKQESYLGFTNPVLTRPSYYLVEKFDKKLIKEYVKKDEVDVAREVIKLKLATSINYRLKDLPYGNNARMVYGMADFLPGLIIDAYVNMVVVQINTAGLDRFRDLIKSELEKFFPEKELCFLDNEKQRSKEQLPQYEPSLKNKNLMIQDGRLQLEIEPRYWQKNGYYYDHRDNREKLYQKLTKLQLKIDNGLDLFCYLGSWGITALLAGVKNIEFVDQANLGSQLDINLRKNHLMGRGVFHHGDVFNFLDHKIHEEASYGLIISDPPSFAKSLDKKSQAILGYKKLHKKVLQLLAPRGLVCFASCTHYVTNKEFESTIMEAANICKRNLKLIDTGVQALDHPFVNFNDKSYYLKYYVYLSE